jgi:hypothetical protein
MEWEYEIAEASYDYTTKDLLDGHGREGWELVAVALVDRTLMHYFKRPKTGTGAQAQRSE